MVRPGLVCFDWDGTLRPGASMRAWARFLDERGELNRGSGAAVERVYERWERAEITHDELVEQVVAGYGDAIAGTRVDALARRADEFVAEDAGRVVAFARPLLAWLRARGITAAIVSGSPLEMLHPHAARLGVDHVLATEVAIRGGTYTGEIARNGGLAAVKARAVGELAQRFEIVAAFGDSASDLPLLRAAAVPVVVGDAEVGLASALRCDHDGAELDAIRSAIERVTG